MITSRRWLRRYSAGGALTDMGKLHCLVVYLVGDQDPWKFLEKIDPQTFMVTQSCWKYQRSNVGIALPFAPSHIHHLIFMGGIPTIKNKGGLLNYCYTHIIRIFPMKSTSLGVIPTWFHQIFWVSHGIPITRRQHLPARPSRRAGGSETWSHGIQVAKVVSIRKGLPGWWWLEHDFNDV